MHGCTASKSIATLLLVVSAIISLTVHAAERTPQQESFDRLQEEQRRREQRRADDVFLPGPGRAAEQVDIEPSGPCFTVTAIELRVANGLAPQLESLLSSRIQAATGVCLTAFGLQQLHRELSNHLTGKGFVTSRLLIPEQDLDQAELVFVLVAGRIERVETEGLSSRKVRLALPVRSGRLLNLRDLEQAIENLGRVRGLEAAFDILPGSDNGESVLRMQGQQGRRVGATMVVNEKYYGSTMHGSALLNTEIGSPFGLTDRLLVSLNTDLDRAVSDRSWGGGVDYEIGLRYWLIAAGFSRQAYLNKVDATFERLDATGETDTSRFEVGRVLHRSSTTRVNLTALFSYSDVLNELDDTVIRVSSYQLNSSGARLDISYRWQRLQLSGGVTAEYSEGHGPGTALLTGESIADIHNQRVQLNISGMYPFVWQNGSLQLRWNGQHSDNELFPLQRFSVASGVRGLDDISVTGNSGHTFSMEYAISPRIGSTGIWARPFVATELGWVPSQGDETEFNRLAGLTVGSDVSWKRMRIGLEASAPIKRVSTRESDNSHVVRARMTLTF